MRISGRMRVMVLAIGIALVVVAAVGLTQRHDRRVSSDGVFSASGAHIASGDRVSGRDLLPLTLIADPDTRQVKFVLDGTYLGTDQSRPFQPTIGSLSAGEHVLRYTVQPPAAPPTKVSVKFTVVGSAQQAASPTGTTSSPAAQSPVTPPSAVGSPASAITVSDAPGLQRALANARPGAVITLADGAYDGNTVRDPSGQEPGRFVISHSGTASEPITLRGSRKAVVDGGGVGGGYAIHLRHAQYWRLIGFTVQSAAKGIVLDGSSHNVLDSLHVTDIGQEGVHFRAFSSDNILRNSEVDNTGVTSPNFGEGVYLGSAVSNWQKYTGGQPDRSDRNQVVNNKIFDTAAECIDIKEGTTGGTISGNYLGGNKIAGKNSADSWIDVKGNGYLITRNHGVTAPKVGTTECGDPKGGANPSDNPFCDGIQVHVPVPGWGANNVFTKNVLEVNAPGVGIWLQNTAIDLHNVIRCDNVVVGAASGNFAYDHYTAIGCTT